MSDYARRSTDCVVPYRCHTPRRSRSTRAFGGNKMVHRSVLALSTAALLFSSSAWADADCPPGKLRNPSGTACADVVDMTAQFAAVRGGTAPLPPRRTPMQQPTSGGLSTNFTTPNGVAVGVTYQVGHFHTTNLGGVLMTLMSFHPLGIGTSSYIFTTATNRTEKGVEVLGAYATGVQDLDIFDWSCSPTYPCTGGNLGTKTAADYVYRISFLSLSSSYKLHALDSSSSGHTRWQIQYANSTLKSDPTVSPPQWTNKVSLWNYSTSAWNVIYTHIYNIDQLDCSTANACGWWGPIAERTTTSIQANIHEIGYQTSQIYTDSATWTALGATDTTWNPPESTYEPTWNVYHHTTNQTWGSGQNTTE